MPTDPGFAGFHPDGFRFFQELHRDNSKAFWEANKHRYLEHVRAPLEALARELEGAFGEPDAVMMLRVQRERQNAAFFPSAREYSRRYGLDVRRLGMLPRHTIVMHPGPMNRGLEISAAAADSARSTIVEQVSNGVAVRMAVLYLLLSGRKDPATGPVVTGGRTGGADGATRKDRRR